MTNEEQNPSLSIGDIVTLKSGGPKMTVEFVRGQRDDDPVSCVWFTAQHEAWNRSDFTPSTLVKVSQ